MTPGSNILKKAFSVIATQTLGYEQFTGFTVNAVKNQMPSYAPTETIKGSFQPVPRRLYDNLGLNLEKEYYNFFIDKNLLGVDRNRTGDKITFNGVAYRVESETEWFLVDSWAELLCAKID